MNDKEVRMSAFWFWLIIGTAFAGGRLLGSNPTTLPGAGLEVIAGLLTAVVAAGVVHIIESVRQRWTA